MYNLTGQLATAGWQWLLTIWLVRFFGVSELGVFSFILAVISPLLLFCNFQLRNRLAAQPDLLANVPIYLRLRLMTTVVCVIVASVWVVSVQPGIDILLLVGVLAFKSMEASAEILHGVLQAEEKLHVAALGMGIKALLALGLMLAVITFQGSSGIFFVSLAVGYALINYVVEWRSAKAVHASPGPGSWRILRKDPHLFSLGAVAWLGSLSASWPRYQLQQHHGMEVLGEFTAIFAIYAVLGVILNAWLQGMIRPLAKETRPSKTIVKLFFQMATYHLLAGAVLVPWGADLLGLMFNRAVLWPRQEIMLLLLLSLTAGVSTLLYYYLLTVYKMSRQWVVMIGANCSVALTGHMLIPQEPMLGGVLALLAGAIFQLVCYSIMSFSTLTKSATKALP